MLLRMLLISSACDWDKVVYSLDVVTSRLASCSNSEAPETSDGQLLLLTASASSSAPG